MPGQTNIPPAQEEWDDLETKLRAFLDRNPVRDRHTADDHCKTCGYYHPGGAPSPDSGCSEVNTALPDAEKDEPGRERSRAVGTESMAEAIGNIINSPHTLSILNERVEIYGNAETNLNCAASLIHFYDDAVARGPRPRTHGPLADDIAMHMVLLKIARIATGKYHEDNYTDAIGYLELARELHPHRPKE